MGCGTSVPAQPETAADPEEDKVSLETEVEDGIEANNNGGVRPKTSNPNLNRSPNMVPGLIGTGAKYGLVSKVPMLDNDILEDEEADDEAEIETVEEGKTEEERKHSAASFPDGSRKPSPAKKVDSDDVSDTVGSVEIVDISKLDDKDDKTSTKENAIDNPEQEKELEASEKDSEINMEKETEPSEGLQNNQEEDGEASKNKSDILDQKEDQEERKDDTNDKNEDEISEEKEVEVAEKEEEKPVPNGTVVHEEEAHEGTKTPPHMAAMAVPDSQLLGSRVSLRSNKSHKSHQSHLQVSAPPSRAGSSHSTKSHHSHHSSRSQHSKSHHSAKSHHSSKSHISSKSHKSESSRRNSDVSRESSPVPEPVDKDSLGKGEEPSRTSSAVNVAG